MFRAIPSDERPIGPDDGQFLPKLVREVLPTIHPQHSVTHSFMAEASFGAADSESADRCEDGRILDPP
jgi:hypothetical protein